MTIITGSEAGFHFEGLKVGWRQDKNGYVLLVSVHPAEVPDAFIRSAPGQRYMIAMVPIGDDEQPEDDQAQENVRALRRAASLCRDKEFTRWLCIKSGREMMPGDNYESFTDTLLKDALKIKSKTAIRDDPIVRERFRRLDAAYRYWRVENGL